MKKVYIYIIVVIFLSSTVGSCKNKSSVDETAPIESIAPSSMPKELSPADFEQKMKTTPNLYLVDVRTPEEFNEKRISGAVNMNIQDAGFENAVRVLDVNRPVFVYCLSGGRSSSAAEVFQKAGFKDVYNLEGGLMKWGAEGKPVEQGDVAKTSGMSMEDYNKLVVSAPVVMVDFNAIWCGPCKKLRPVLEEMEKQGKFKLISVDVDENPNISEHFKIESIPLMKLYKNGKEVWNQLGFDDSKKEEEITNIENALKNAK